MDSYTYPSSERLVEYNLLALELIRVKKSDTPKVLSLSKLLGVIRKCESEEGNIYDKAVVLLKGLL